MACLSRLAVASVNTHRTRWPTPTPTQTRSYIHLCTQMYNPPPPPLRTELPFSFRQLQPSSVSPATRLHGHRTSSLLSRRSLVPTFLPTAESEFCKSHTVLALLTIILKRKFERILINSACTAVNYSPTFKAGVPSLLGASLFT